MNTLIIGLTFILGIAGAGFWLSRAGFMAITVDDVVIWIDSNGNAESFTGTESVP